MIFLWFSSTLSMGRWHRPSETSIDQAAAVCRAIARAHHHGDGPRKVGPLEAPGSALQWGPVSNSETIGKWGPQTIGTWGFHGICSWFITPITMVYGCLWYLMISGTIHTGVYKATNITGVPHFVWENNGTIWDSRMPDIWKNMYKLCPWLISWTYTWNIYMFYQTKYWFHGISMWSGFQPETWCHLKRG